MTIFIPAKNSKKHPTIEEWCSTEPLKPGEKENYTITSIQIDSKTTLLHMHSYDKDEPDEEENNATDENKGE